MASNSKVAKVGKSAKFITVQKWETELNCKLECDTTNGKVEKLVCSTCKKWERRISGSSNFSLTWIQPGLTNVEKDSLVKHLKGEQHESAANLQTKREMGAEVYQRNFINVALIFTGTVKMKEKNWDSMRIKFNSTYYLAKMDRPFSDYNNLLKLRIKNKVTGIKPKHCSWIILEGGMKKSLAESVAIARYFACLSDGSTDSSVTEQEVVYVLFLDNGVPIVKYVSIESAENANAERVKKKHLRMHFRD